MVSKLKKGDVVQVNGLMVPDYYFVTAVTKSYIKIHKTKFSKKTGRELSSRRSEPLSITKALPEEAKDFEICELRYSLSETLRAGEGITLATLRKIERLVK